MPEYSSTTVVIIVWALRSVFRTVQGPHGGWRGGAKTAGIYKDGGARVGKNEGDYRGRSGMGENRRG